MFLFFPFTRQISGKLSRVDDQVTVVVLELDWTFGSSPFSKGALEHFRIPLRVDAACEVPFWPDNP